MHTARDLYTPHERRLFDEFFGMPGQKRLPLIDTSPIKAVILGEYRAWRYAADDDEEGAIPTNVAQVVLAPLQQRLPNAAVFRGDDLQMTRRQLRKRGARVTPLPVYLFTIDWALTAPGLSWPETYHVAPVIGYGRQLVTVSVDSRDVYGIEDFPIGSFVDEVAVEKGCHAIITAWWRTLKKEWMQNRFEIIEKEGLIDSQTVYAWDMEVWGPYPEEDEMIGIEEET